MWLHTYAFMQYSLEHTRRVPQYLPQMIKIYLMDRELVGQRVSKVTVRAARASDLGSDL